MESKLVKKELITHITTSNPSHWITCEYSHWIAKPSRISSHSGSDTLLTTFTPSNWYTQPSPLSPITLGLSVLTLFTLSHWVTQLSRLSLNHTGSPSPYDFHSITLGRQTLTTSTPLHWITQPLRHPPSHRITESSRLLPYHTGGLSPNDFHPNTLVNSASRLSSDQPSRHSSHHTGSPSHFDTKLRTLDHPAQHLPLTLENWVFMIWLYTLFHSIIWNKRIIQK